MKEDIVEITGMPAPESETNEEELTELIDDLMKLDDSQLNHLLDIVKDMRREEGAETLEI